MSLPDYLILGETKCGTTSLFNYLIQHPDIIDTKGNHEKYDAEYNTKEIRYFDRHYDKDLNWYESCFYEMKEGQITGEATPMYFYRTISIKRIKNVLPDAKFIVLLRNPSDRLFSNFFHNCKWVPGFKEKYANFYEFWNKVHDTDIHLIERGIYYFTIIKWLEQFNINQFCFIKSEDLFIKPEATYNKVLNFLNVSRFKLREFKIYRKNDYPQIDDAMKKKVEEFYRCYNKKLKLLLNIPIDWNY